MNSKIFILLCCSILLVQCNYDEDEGEEWYPTFDYLHSLWSSYDGLTYYSGKWESLGLDYLIKMIRNASALRKYYEIPGNDYKMAQDLRVLLECTTMSNFTTECREDTLVILGHVIKLSDLIDGDTYKFKDFCGQRKIKNVNIFSSFTIFFDRHLMAKGDELSLTIIAPRWIVIGPNVTINLQGYDGSGPGLNVVKSNDRNPEKRDIYASPGGPGGNFYGIGEEFGSAENLTIDVSGGKGGPSEDGEFHFARWDTSVEEDSYDEDFESVRDDNWSPARNKELLLRDTYRDVWNYSPSETALMLEHACKDNSIRLPDANGPKYLCKQFYPGNFVVYNMTHISRDHGSSVGEGGHPGVLEMHAPNGEPKISKLGEAGKKLNQRTNGSFIWFWFNGLGKGHVAFHIRNDAKVFHDKIVAPEPAHVVTRKTKLRNINEAKKFFRTQLTNRYESARLIRFLTLMDEDNDIINLYDAEALIRDLDDLDKEVYHLNINKLPLYESLLLRVESYLIMSANHRKIVENKNILVYLASSIYTRVYFLEKTKSPILITDMQLYLETLLKGLRRIEKMERKHNIITTVTEALSGVEGYKQNFDYDIYRKINETGKLINETIQPEIEKLRQQFGEDIKNLVAEVAELKDQKEPTDKMLREKKKLLSWNILESGVLRAINLLAPLVGLLVGGSGAIIGGAAVGVLASAGQEYISENGGSVDGYINQIRKDMQSQYKMAQAAYTALQAEERAKFYAAIKKLYKDSKIGENVKTVLNYATGKMARARNLQEVTSVIAETSAALTPVQSLQDFQDNVKVFFTMADEAMKIQNLFTDYNKDRKKIDVIDEELKANEENFKRLEAYEHTIYSVISPILTNMMEDIDVDENFLINNPSKMTHLLKKWRISEALKKVKHQIGEMVNGFQVKGSILEHIDSLKDSITTLIGIYSSIENYQRDQDLADYVARVVATSTDLITDDDKFKDQRFRLDRKISNALIWKQYQTTIEAFKQFTFPFAKLYFQGMYRMSEQPVEHDIEDLATFVADRVERLLSNLKEYKATKSAADKCTEHSSFETNYTKPFYVWSNKEKKSSISSLLGGYVITVMANLADAKAKGEAMKFRTIELTFTSKNKTAEKKLNDLLKLAFSMQMSHMGDSYYRFRDKIYMLPSPVEVFRYSFKRKPGSNEPVIQGGGYNKTRNGDFVLSPFATWKFQLLENLNKEENVNVNWTDLQAYENYVDMNLVGKGFYINEKAWECPDLMAERYYQEFIVSDLSHSRRPRAVSAEELN